MNAHNLISPIIPVGTNCDPRARLENSDKGSCDKGVLPYTRSSSQAQLPSLYSILQRSLLLLKLFPLQPPLFRFSSSVSWSHFLSCLYLTSSFCPTHLCPKLTWTCLFALSSPREGLVMPSPKERQWVLGEEAEDTAWVLYSPRNLQSLPGPWPCAWQDWPV